MERRPKENDRIEANMAKLEMKRKKPKQGKHCDDICIDRGHWERNRQIMFKQRQGQIKKKRI